MWMVRKASPGKLSPEDCYELEISLAKRNEGEKLVISTIHLSLNQNQFQKLERETRRSKTDPIAAVMEVLREIMGVK